NPNGITCNGCGFVNVHRGMLATSSPEIKNGHFDSLLTTRGDIVVGPNGIISYDTPQIDLIAMKAIVNGKIHGTYLTQDNHATSIDNLNLIVGPGQVSYRNPSASPVTQGGTLDVSQLGGMYARKIYLVGAGVRHAGETTAAGNLFIKAKTIFNTGTVKSGNNLIVETDTATNQNGTMYATHDLNIKAQQDIKNISGLIRAGSINIEADTLINETQIILGNRDADNYADVIKERGRFIANHDIAIKTRGNLVIKGAVIHSHLGKVDLIVGGKTTIASLLLDKKETTQSNKTLSSHTWLQPIHEPGSNRLTYRTHYQTEESSLNTKITKQSVLPASVTAHKNLSLLSDQAISLTGIKLFSQGMMTVKSKSGDLNTLPLFLIHAAWTKERQWSIVDADVINDNSSIQTVMRMHHINTHIAFGQQLDWLAEAGTIHLGGADFFSRRKPDLDNLQSSLTMRAQEVQTTPYKDKSSATTKTTEHFAGVTYEGHSNVVTAINHAVKKLDAKGSGNAYVRASLLRGAQTVGDSTNLVFGDTLGGSADFVWGNSEQNKQSFRTNDGVSQMHADHIYIESTQGDIELVGIDMRSNSIKGKITLDAAKNITLAEAETAGTWTLDSKSNKFNLGATASANAMLASAGVGIRGGYARNDNHQETFFHNYAPMSVIAKTIWLTSGGIKKVAPIANSFAKDNHVRILGSRLIAETVDLYVTGDLSLQSFQNTRHATSDENHWGGSLGVDANVYTIFGLNGGGECWRWEKLG
ncbi:MAG: hemagglutinin repeat-containing protein, partial [Ottowia sp.]|nr:hemagglutinin repeat-containing protein [Ottowia sp.]